MAEETKIPASKTLKKPGRSTKDRAQDDQVMGTNNSSIVSKRSVEKLYYPDEAHFFRYFVKKFQRRAPLINRGYYLRMHVIDVAVRDFVQRDHDGRQKIVINLGCGYDVLPWQTWTRYPEDCKDVKFIDIDFPDLMLRKKTTVLSTPQLVDSLTNLETSETGTVLLKSDHYAQIGCDLRQLDGLRTALSEIVDIPNCSFIFVAEVSITYMETEAADALIQWACGLGRSEFCLLEQILPDGPDHPFAKTMLSHFDKLSTPLKSVHRYQTLETQQERFVSRGWPAVKASSLWQAWADEKYLSSAQRQKLDEVESFDEWEEFALFASHYCIMDARNYGTDGDNTTATAPPRVPWQTETAASTISDSPCSYEENPGTKGQRRFGTVMQAQNRWGQPCLANVMGLGTSSRLSTSDVYHWKKVAFDKHGLAPVMDAGPSSRMCHTITDLGAAGQVLVGGRTHPGNALRDCWLFSKGENKWKRTHDLPVPIYRHSIVRLGESSFALLIGGKTDSSAIFDGCLLFHPEQGWVDVEIKCFDGAIRTSSLVYNPVFGAAMVEDHDFDTDRTDAIRRAGYLLGGMTSDCLIANQLLHWTVNVPYSPAEKPYVRISRIKYRSTSVDHTLLFNRFGAVCVSSKSGPSPKQQVLIGGVTKDHLLPHEYEVIQCAFPNTEFLKGRIQQTTTPATQPLPRPLLVGHSVSLMDDGHVVILGGGATCFSMGTCWNKGVYTLKADINDECVEPLTYVQTVETAPGTAKGATARTDSEGALAPEITSIPRVSLQSTEEFAKMLKKGRPAVLTDLDLGSCVANWALDYMVEKVGAERKVVVHDSTTPNMDFNTKNFGYVTKTFAHFADEVRKGNRLYLRALSTEEPSALPANLTNDFPEIAGDFFLPPQLSFVEENTFSSVLRISGPVNMWLHYDVMANVYCQMQGSKRLILFPPADVEHLNFAPGASSSSIDVFSKLDSPSLGPTHPYEAILSPGDVLFIPPLWLHTATPKSDTSIAVNVFFRDLENGYSAGRDVYGNRDLAAYEKGRQDANKLVSSFQKLPAQAREFYLLRLADELRQMMQN
ncbi:methyltransferase-like protein [Coniochaeta sp. 2T2.1]|nr:methyltransferase-like protein [Coniochaeta sp. 2T2.1]